MEIVNSAGPAKRFMASGNSGVTTALSLANPSGVATDDHGTVYFVDNSNNRVCKVTPDGMLTTVVLGFPNNLSDLLGLAMGSSNSSYIADAGHNRICRVNQDGTLTTVAGDGDDSYYGDGGQATQAGVHQPFGVAMDTLGNLYIAEASSDRIRKVDTNGIITTVAGNGFQSSYTYYVGDG